MINNYNELCEILKKDSRLVDTQGTLLKNKIQELAHKMDKELIKLLNSNPITHEMFFVDIDGLQIFDKNEFSYIINSSEFLPDSYTKFKQNIMLVDENRQSIKYSNDVVLEFPNKDCILEFDSTDEDEERDEVFFNEILAKSQIDTLLDHKMLVNAKRFVDGKIEENITSFNNDNILIKGNNLLALHTLYPKYKSSIKLMYWDILYNTNNDQVPYNDSFKHSSWLTMMKNRLEIAKKLLKDDGVIVLQCDKNEDSYLKVLCDEVFGRDNFINHICVKSSSASGTKTAHKEKTIIKLTDTILVYKNGGELKINPQFEKKTKWDSHYSVWLYKDEETNTIKEKPLLQILKEKKIIDEKQTFNSLNVEEKKFKEFYLKNANNIGRWSTHKCKEAKEYGIKHPKEIFEFEDKGFFKDGNQFSPVSSTIQHILGAKKDVDDIGMLLGDIWLDIDFNNTQNEGGNSLPAGKKPEFLIRRIVEMFTNQGDIVLDAYLGSGTTAAVCHKINRKYIGIEQLDKHFKMANQRLNDVIKGDTTGISEAISWNGGGCFVSCELAENSQLLIEKIQNSNDTELLNIYEELKKSPFVLYTVDIRKMENEQNGFENLSLDDKRKFLISIIDKNTLYINYSDINNEDYHFSESDKKFTDSFYKGE